MYQKIPVPWLATVGVALLAAGAFATQVPRVSFEALTDSSEVVVSGRISHTWTAWDAAHKYIWTHYRLTVTSTLKGAANSVMEFAEPGGEADGRLMTIDGAVTYSQGEEVVVFLSRMPNRYLRTTGWSQGKYVVDASGRLHAFGGASAESIQAGRPSTGSSLRMLEGMSVTELKQRVSSRLSAGQGKVQ